MKKIISVFLTLLLCAAYCVVGSAKSGDIAGQYYSTDICTFLNGVEIDSINIGGQTLISAEDMNYYAFSVYWEAEERALRITHGMHAVNGAPPAVQKPDVPAGTVLGDYYETDIKTYLDGEEITAYNIGGRTYIWAEQMRDFGFEVLWDAQERTLHVTDPGRAGYEYSISLTSGKYPKEAEEGLIHSSDGQGAFSVTYHNGEITGSGDAERFGSALVYNGKYYSVPMGFYQNAGLFFSLSLQQLLRSLAYEGNISDPCAPEDKYELVNQNVTVILNGQKAEKVAVSQTQGNGHQDYTLQIFDLPRYHQDEITDLYIEVGGGGEGSFTIVPENPFDEIESIISSLKKNPEDFEVAYYDGEDYLIVDMYVSPSLGVIEKEALYIVNRKTGEVSEDVLDQVRQVEGFDQKILHVFANKIGDVPTNYFFSCGVDGRTGDFYVELPTGTVHTVALSPVRD